MSAPLTLHPHRHGDEAALCDVSAARTRKAPHVVIVGAGFGGLAAAKALSRAPVQVTLIDRRNYHLFQPLLYQVATAGLSPAEIASPIRRIVSDHPSTTVLMAEVIGVDKHKREVVLSDQRVPYDYLVLATGARHFYFGHDAWEPFAPGLKSLDDATDIRRRILQSFETAEIECDAAERERLLTFVIIGAGPTGVEMAGAIAEIAKHALASDFRNIDPKSARILLVEAGPRILPAFREELSDYAKRTLSRLGVEVRTGEAVTACDAEGATVGTERIRAGAVIWAAGVMASPAARWLGVPADRAGRVVVDERLNVPGLDNVFVIGDTAGAWDKSGKPLPGLAPIAKQQGHYVAKRIRALISGQAAPKAFIYQSFGNLATIGRKAAVVEFGPIRLTGFIAWLLWSIAHIYFLIGFRNRLVVALSWLWAYLTYERGARLITGGDRSAPPSETHSAKRIAS